MQCRVSLASIILGWMNESGPSQNRVKTESKADHKLWNESEFERENNEKRGLRRCQSWEGRRAQLVVNRSQTRWNDKRIETYFGQRPAWCMRAAALKPSVSRVEQSWATRSVTMRTSSGCQAVRREWTSRTRAIFGTRVTGAANVIASHMAVEPSILVPLA